MIIFKLEDLTPATEKDVVNAEFMLHKSDRVIIDLENNNTGLAIEIRLQDLVKIVDELKKQNDTLEPF